MVVYTYISLCKSVAPHFSLPSFRCCLFRNSLRSSGQSRRLSCSFIQTRTLLVFAPRAVQCFLYSILNKFRACKQGFWHCLEIVAGSDG